MRYEIVCLSIGLIVGEILGLTGGFAHQAGITDVLRIAVVGFLFGALIGALLALLIAFGGRYLFGPAVTAGAFIGALVGVITAIVGQRMPTLRLSLIFGLILGGLIGYLLCRLCRVHHRFSHQ